VTRETPFERRDMGRRLDLLLQIGTAIITLAATAFVLFFVLQERQRILASAAVNTQNLASLLDESLTASFDKIDLALRAVQDEVERRPEGRPANAELQKFLDRQRERAPDLRAIRLLAENGDVVLSAPPTSMVANVADRQYFAELRAGARSVVSKPMVGRVVPGLIMVFGRPLARPDGSFAGAVIAPIDLDHIAAMLARLDVGRHGVVVLRADDLQPLARTDTRGPTGLMDPSAVSGELKRLVASGRTTGTYEALAPSDQTRRIVTFRRLDHHPLYIIVGLANDDQLSSWRREAGTDLGLLLSFNVLTWLGAALAGRAVRRQRSAEERLAATLRSIGEGVIAIDVQRRVLFMNGVAERLTGCGSEESRGRPLEEVYHLVERRTRMPLPGAVTRALETMASVETPGRIAVQGRDGALHAVAETGAPIRDRSGAVRGAVLVFRDTTAQERAEEELTRVQKVESLAVLAGGIAHDFNNLLTGITGNLSLAREQASPETEVAAALADAEAAALRARSLTHQLLTFSRGGAPVKSRVDLSTLVEEVARFAAHGAGTALQFDLSPDLPVDVDPGQIGQVVQNLVINGIQAMASSGTLRVETRRVRSAGGLGAGAPATDLALLAVTDSGPGIPSEVLPHIFDPFFTTKVQGKGLGLTICHSIVTRHGGSIDASSPAGQGATFRVTLPVSRPPERADPTGQAVAPRQAAGCRILIMDDEETVRRLAERTLQPLGYEVAGARDGREAVALYGEALQTGRPFAAVVMDLTIPGGMGGLETLDRLRAVDPGVVAIVSSGYSNNPVMAAASSHGFHGILAKPYVADDLRNAVARALRR